MELRVLNEVPFLEWSVRESKGLVGMIAVLDMIISGFLRIYSVTT